MFLFANRRTRLRLYVILRALALERITTTRCVRAFDLPIHRIARSDREKCFLHPHLGEFFGDGAFGERAQIGGDVDAGDDGDAGASRQTTREVVRRAVGVFL